MGGRFFVPLNAVNREAEVLPLVMRWTDATRPRLTARGSAKPIPDSQYT